MFCPKCGTQNPDAGKFCRSCGTDLGNVSSALSGNLRQQQQYLTDHKGRPVTWDRAITKLFTGLAFLVVSIILAFTDVGNRWWFWMLIPAFLSIGAGLAQFIQLRKVERGQPVYSPNHDSTALGSEPRSGLPPSQTEYVAPAVESRFKTGDLVPPSVTDSTTRHLEIDSEGKTMNLPKK